MKNFFIILMISFLFAGCNIVPKSVQYQQEEEKVMGSTDIVNPMVNVVQVVLTKLGYDTGNTEGRMEQKTREAIKAFQESVGLKGSGYIDMNTWRQIEDTRRAEEQRQLEKAYKIEVKSTYPAEKAGSKAGTGATTKEIQAALKNAGFDPGAIDGKMGPKTKQAIKEFQRAKGLSIDGTVGPKTWLELKKYLNVTR